MPKRSLFTLITLLVFAVLCIAGCGGCMVAAHAAGAHVATASSIPILSEPATLWDILKSAGAMVLAIVAWAWRVEARLAKAEEQSEVKERLARLEAKIDLILGDRNR